MSETKTPPVDERENFRVSDKYGAIEGAQDVVEYKTGCPGVCGRIFPIGYWKEFKETFILAWPLFMTELTRMLLGPVALIFCGQLGREELDGVGLAISMMNVTCISIAQGLGTACDTLFSQCFGSSNKKLMGIYLQRALLILILASIPPIAIHLNMEAILVALGQERAVAKIAGRYLLIFIPGNVAQFIYQVLSKFIQNQNIVIPNLVIGIMANGINAILQYIFIFQLDMGIVGSAIAMTISHCSFMVATLAYILISGVYKDCWDGWSKESWREWGQFLKLGIPGMMMTCIEWWSFEVGIFLAGLLGAVELGAQSILFQLTGITYMIPLGMSIACSIRVGQELGAGRAMGARTAAYVSYSVVAVTSIIISLLLLVLRWELPRIFTPDEEVIKVSASLIPILASYMFFDSTAAIGMGTLRGSGRQFLGSVVIFICYYILALPIGIPLMFLTVLEMAGLWWALCGALFIEALTFFIVILATDWDKQVAQASARTHAEFSHKEDMAKHYHDEIEANVDGVGSADESAALISSTDRKQSLEDRRSMLAMAKRPRRYSGRYQDTLEEPILLSTVASNGICTKQLFCRRTVALTIFAGILVAGLLCRLLVTIPPSPSGPICIPRNATNSTMPVINVNASSLPFCDELFTTPVSLIL